MSTGAPDSGQHDRAVVSEERALAFLASGELELLGRIPWASNATVLAKLTHEGLEGLAVYKPARGERPLWDFPDGTLYRREVAAYLVSEQLGWRLVPPTLARDGPLGVGSVQLYVDADPEVTAFELLGDGNPSMARIAAFDVVTNNADRKAGHCLAGQDGHVWAIDHGLCFHVQAKLRTVLWDLAGDRLDAGGPGRPGGAGRRGDRRRGAHGGPRRAARPGRGGRHGQAGQGAGPGRAAARPTGGTRLPVAAGLRKFL